MLAYRRTVLKATGLCLLIATVIYVTTRPGNGDSLIGDRYFAKIAPKAMNKISSKSMRLDDGALNEGYFREFRYHWKERVSDTKQLVKANKKIYEAAMQLVEAVEVQEDGELESATFVALVQTKDLESIVKAVKQIEEKFNHKYHYPWTFLNDRVFTNRFMSDVRAATKSEVEFVQISRQLWAKPDFIDSEKEKLGVKFLKENNIQYASKKSYHNMCRFYSGNIFKVPELSKYRYYWRVEPGTNYFCDIEYDVFKFMRQNNKTYGFNTNIYDQPQTIRGLWDATVDFLTKNPQYLNVNGLQDWLLQDVEHPEYNAITKGYSTCHFWTNFEIVDMDLFRREAYTKYFDHLNAAGGFYYERWGDAPVRSIALGLFEDKANIHWFKDIGYQHHPYLNCPKSAKCQGCSPGLFTPYQDNEDQNCMANWIKYSMKK